MIQWLCLRANIIGIGRFYHSIAQGEKAFCQQLADGATLAVSGNWVAIGEDLTLRREGVGSRGALLMAQGSQFVLKLL